MQEEHSAESPAHNPPLKSQQHLSAKPTAGLCQSCMCQVKPFVGQEDTTIRRTEPTAPATSMARQK